MKAELLDAETERRLAYAWRDDRDVASLHRLINAYMRLAISMAAKFKRYGAPMNDLIQEAGLGLMKRQTSSIRTAACGSPPMRCGGSRRRSRIT